VNLVDCDINLNENKPRKPEGFLGRNDFIDYYLWLKENIQDVPNLHANPDEAGNVSIVELEENDDADVGVNISIEDPLENSFEENGNSENSSIEESEESGAEKDENSSTEDFEIGGLFIADNNPLEVAANNSSQTAGNSCGSRNKRVYYHRCP
jgi:hypothetical protein